MGSKPQGQAGITEKVELHVHLDGAIRPETVLEFGKKRGIKLPADNVEELKKHMCVYDTPGDFWEFLRTFGVFVPCVAGDKEAIFRMAYEFCEDCAKDNITYVEARYNPQILANDAPKPFYAPTTGNVGPRDVVETVLAGFEKGSYDFGITAKTILCCIVDCPEWSMEVLHLCEEFRNRGVVAIDLASGEHESPHDANLPRHLEAFRSARLLGLHRTMHAGEVGDSESVRRAVDLFHTERIGHGYHVLDDPKLYNDLREKDIHFEVCPNSAIRTGSVPEAVQNYELHPAKRFANDGVNFSINRDDPLPFDTSLTDEYDFVTKMGLTQDQLVTCIFNAADNCFAPPDERIGLLKRLSAVYGRTWTPR